jgi:ketosteroid isomerase-like protein
MIAEFNAAWEEHRSDPEEVRVIDDERVLVLTIEHFRGRDGIEFDQPCGTIFTLRGGKITRMQSFWERETALEAAGLSG